MSEKAVLRDAMLALHDELAALESDIGAASRNPRLSRVVERWESQREKASQFFDWDVYLDRESAVAA